MNYIYSWTDAFAIVGVAFVSWIIIMGAWELITWIFS